jgi:hypothetical protein
MIGRRQLTVASPISPSSVVGAFVESLGSPDSIHRRARELVMREFGSGAALLTDSGTSALVLALRLAMPKGGVVAYPGYACVDLAAAARFAGVRVRVYDLDPATLSPDLDSVRRTLDRGVDAIVVAHLFGYAADVPAVRELAAARGITTIEDAAQAAGGTLHGRRLGSFGDLSVASFGRGKGLCAGGGGAVLSSSDRYARTLGAMELAGSRRGWSGLTKTAIQWALGRPSLYALPSMLPWLHLGEMVYHPANEPRAMSVASNALVVSAFALETNDLAIRRRHARELGTATLRSKDLLATLPIHGSEPGFLRYAVRDPSGARRVEASLGIARPYPQTLLEQSELRPALMGGEPPTPGAEELRDLLFTLPTHRFVEMQDLAALERWMNRALASASPAAVA